MIGPNSQLLKEAFWPACWTVLAGSAVWAILGAVAVLWPGAVMLNGSDWIRVVGANAVASWSVVFPAAGAVGVVLTIGAWRDCGAWDGLRAAGWSGRQLLPGVVCVGLLVMLATGLMSNLVEPAARRVLAQTQHRAVAGVMLWPERTLEVGPVAIRPRRTDGTVAHDVFLAIGDVVGSAARAEVVAVDGDVAVDLENVVLLGGRWRMRADRWRAVIPAVRNRRVVMQERSNAALAAAAERTRTVEKKDPSYELALLYKRYLHPIAAGLFPLAVLPLGVRRRRGLWLALAGVGYLIAVRGGDSLATAAGPWFGASIGPLYIVVLGAVLWSLWRDR